MLKLRSLSLLSALCLASAGSVWAEDKPGEKPEANKTEEKKDEGRKEEGKKGDKPEQNATGDKTPEQVFKEHDKDGNGELTKDEIAEDKQRFFEHLLRVGDKDKNGKLTQAEFKEGVKPDDLKPATGQRGDRAQQVNLDQMFDRLDANKDGKVSKSEIPERGREFLDRLFKVAGKEELTKEEFRKGAEAGRGAGGQGNDAEQLFTRLDVNNDGKVSKSEIPERGRQFLEQLFQAAGKDELTKEEFRKGVESGRRAGGQGGDAGEMFDRLDVNNDGKLTKSEIPETRKEMFGRLFEKVGKEELTRDEFKSGFDALRGASRSAGDRAALAPNSLFARIDTNRDGKLSKEELAKAVDLFEELDRNKDGQIEPRELFGAERDPISKPDGERKEGEPKEKEGDRKKDDANSA